jgi:hypothetical protein
MFGHGNAFFRIFFKENRLFEPQEVGSSSKGLGLGGNPIRSKVQISLSMNNSLESCSLASRSLTRSVKRALCTFILTKKDVNEIMDCF